MKKLIVILVAIFGFVGFANAGILDWFRSFGSGPMLGAQPALTVPQGGTGWSVLGLGNILIGGGTSLPGSLRLSTSSALMFATSTNTLTTTNLTLSSSTNGCVQGLAGVVFFTGADCGTGTGASPFTSNTSWGALAQATTSLLAFPEALISSTTIGRLTMGSFVSTSTSITSEVKGNLDIGDILSQNTLQVLGLSTANMAPVLSLFRSGSVEWTLSAGGASVGDFTISHNPSASNYTDANISSSAHFVIKDSNANVGISTTSPYARLSVAGQGVFESVVSTSTLSCNSLDTDATGKIICGTDTGASFGQAWELLTDANYLAPTTTKSVVVGTTTVPSFTSSVLTVAATSTSFQWLFAGLNASRSLSVGLSNNAYVLASGTDPYFDMYETDSGKYGGIFVDGGNLKLYTDTGRIVFNNGLTITGKDIRGNLVPDAHDQYDIGSSVNGWAGLWLGNDECINFENRECYIAEEAAGDSLIVMPSNWSGFSGLFGIATTHPNAILSVSSTTTNFPLAIFATSTAGTALVIDKQGRVGVGTGGPTVPFEVQGMASTSNLTVSLLNAANCDVKSTNGLLSCGTDSGSYPFTPSTAWGALAQATSSILQMNGALISSSTIGRLTVGDFVATSTASTTGLTVSGQILGYNGSISLPSFSFSDDPNTGMYRSAADTVGFTAGGNLRLSVSDLTVQGGSSAAAFLLDRRGTVSTPAYSFVGDTDTGIYGDQANSLMFSIGGVQAGLFDSSRRFGVGTTSPYSILSVSATSSLSNIPIFSVTANTGTATTTLINATSGGVLDISQGTTRIHQYPSFTVSTTTGATSTTTNPLGVAYVAETWVGVQCFTSVGVLGVSFYDGTNRMNYFVASTTAGKILFTTNNTFTAGEKRYVDVGTSTTKTMLSCTIDKIINQ